MNVRNERKRCCFTLIEIMAVVVIIGILAVVGISVATQQVAKTKKTLAISQIRQIEDGVQMFYMDVGRYPQDLKSLMTKPSDASGWKDGGYLKILPNDSWGHEYFYKIPGPDGRPYVVGSYGADGQEGGDTDNADITCWNIYDEAGKD